MIFEATPDSELCAALTSTCSGAETEKGGRGGRGEGEAMREELGSGSRGRGGGAHLKRRIEFKTTIHVAHS